MFLRHISIIVAALFIFPALNLADIQIADSCDIQSPGDVNNDSQIDNNDVDDLIAYLQGDYMPPVAANADVNGNYCVDPADVYYLMDYVSGVGPAPVECTCVNPPLCPDSCESQYWGDANGDEGTNVGDLVYMIVHLFMGGPPPVYQANGDFNGDCRLDILDPIDFMCTFPWEAKRWPAECNCMWPPNSEDRHCLPGDANGDGEINVGDPVSIITYVFAKGLGPVPFALMSGDANLDFQCNVGDAVYLINFIFRGGPDPASCGDWLIEGGMNCMDPNGGHYDP